MDSIKKDNEKKLAEIFAGIFSSPSECPYYLLSRVTLQLTSILKKSLIEAGAPNVKPAYLGALMALWQENGLKSSELASRAGLEPSSITGLVDRMEKDGLVERRSDSADRRVFHIYLTETGHNVKDPVFKAVSGVLTRAFAQIEPEEIGQLKALLQKILVKTQKLRQEVTNEPRS